MRVLTENNDKLFLNTRSVELQKGFVVSTTTGHSTAGRDVKMTSLSESQYVHFNCLLQGKFNAHVRGQAISLSSGDLNVGYGEGETFHTEHTQDLSTVEVMVAPELLIELAGVDFSILKEHNICQFFSRKSQPDWHVYTAAIQLSHHLNQSHCQKLLLYSNALTFLHWHFKSFETKKLSEIIPQRERRCLYLARDHLLSDLSCAPTIAELSKEVGLNQFKLKKGFKTLFENSIYAYFQLHRMEKARELLRIHNVTETALTMGYSNVSHFSGAFFKQFNVLPGDFRRSEKY